MPEYNEFSEAEHILKDMFEPGLKSQIKREESPLWINLKANSDRVVVRKIVFSAQMENPQGVASRRTASQPLPTAVAGKGIRISIEPGRMYGVIEFDDKVLEAAGTSKEGRGEFIDHVESEIKGLKTTFQEDLGRQGYGNGKGFLSDCGVTSASLTLQLASDANMLDYVEGMHIDILLSATGVAVTNGSDRIIQDVDEDNLTVTLDGDGGGVTTDATHGVTKAGSYDAEMTGLSAIVDDSEDIYGVATAGQRRWKSYVERNVGAFTELKLAKVMRAARSKSGMWIDTIYMHTDMLMQYWWSLTGTKTFDIAKSPVPAKEIGSGYYSLTITINGKRAELMGDDFCPQGTIFGIKSDELGIQHLAEPKFANIKGTILLPNVYGPNETMTYKSVFKYYAEMTCYRRSPHFKMLGVTDMAGW